MTTLALAARTPRSRALGILLCVGALALAAQLAIPLPGTPVPFILTPLVVVLAGLLLGPLDAAGAMVAYLVLGALGAPVFAPMGPPAIARLLSPTGGYLLAYPLAAAVAGWLGAQRPRFAQRALAAMAGMLVIYAGGLAQLMIITGNLATAALFGVLPFAAADFVKALIAGAVSGPRRDARS
ncbi:MAG TPA: biotin transporter BioY [Gemmatimonadaceae bacterium]